MIRKISQNKIISKYKKKQELYSNFASAIKSIIEQLLKGYEYKYTVVSCRSKDILKLKEKVDKKKTEGRVYKSLEEIEDLAGVRVIFYLESDRKNFIDILKNEFGGSARVENEDKINGYKATHIILSLDKKRSSLAEYKKYNGLKCEIQLTSIFYHAWAELEHDITYKKDKNLEKYGLEKLSESFAKMIEHVTSASMIADYINSKYLELKKASNIINSNFESRISKSSNDEIYETLKIFEDLEQKDVDDIFSIVRVILNKKPSKPRVVSVFKDAKMYGKKHEEVMVKALNLLNYIRYGKPDEILKLAFSYSRSNSKSISYEAVKIITEFSKYNYQILKETNIGFSCQRKILDLILLMGLEERINNLNAIEASVKEMLKISFKGFTHDEFDKYTMHSGCLPVSDFLSKLRQDTITLLFSLITNAPLEKKLSLIRILSEVLRMPHNYDYSRDNYFQEMIKNDISLIINGFDDLLFGKQNLIRFPGLVMEIDIQLHRFLNNSIFKNSKSEILKNKIYLDNLYIFFISIIGDRQLNDNKVSWSDIEINKNSFINKVIEMVSDDKLEEWTSKFNIVAGQLIFVESWQFSYFKKLLQKIAQEKPDTVFTIINESFLNNLALINEEFLPFLLDGFRSSGRLDLWDKVVKLVIDSKNANLVSAIFFSFGVGKGYSKDNIRSVDLDLFSSIVNASGVFLFVDRKKENSSIASSVIFGLVNVYMASPVVIENLIIKEINKYKFARNIYLNNIVTGVIRGELDILNFSDNGKKKVINWFVCLEDFNWEAQDLLIKISKNNPNWIIELMVKRIERDIKEKSKKNHNFFDYNNYEPIPYHFNDELIKEITNNPGIESAMIDIVSRSDEHWSLYNWHVSQFLSKIGGPSKEALLKLVRSGKKGDLKRAVSLIDNFGSVDINLCLEIVKRTDDKNILSSVEASLSSAGVVSGLYGMADAYEAKSKLLENYLNDKNRRISKFANNFSKNMLEDSKRERKRASENEKRRKIEYEN